MLEKGISSIQQGGQTTKASFPHFSPEREKSNEPASIAVLFKGSSLHTNATFTPSSLSLSLSFYPLPIEMLLGAASRRLLHRHQHYLRTSSVFARHLSSLYHEPLREKTVKVTHSRGVGVLHDPLLSKGKACSYENFRSNDTDGEGDVFV